MGTGKRSAVLYFCAILYKVKTQNVFMKLFVRQLHRYQHVHAGLIFQKDTDKPGSDSQLEVAGCFHKDSYPQPFSTWKIKKTQKNPKTPKTFLYWYILYTINNIPVIFHLLCHSLLWRPSLYCFWHPSWRSSTGTLAEVDFCDLSGWGGHELLKCWMQKTQHQGFLGQVWHDQMLTWKTWIQKPHHEFLNPCGSGHLFRFLHWCAHFWKIWFPPTHISHLPKKPWNPSFYFQGILERMKWFSRLVFTGIFFLVW